MIFFLLLQFTDDWVVANNIYILKICPKGGGKTPAANVFLGPLTELEREEKADYDQEAHEKKDKKSKKIKMSKDERTNKDNMSGDDEDVLGFSKVPPASFDIILKERKIKKVNMTDHEKELENLAVPTCSKLPPATFDS